MCVLTSRQHVHFTPSCSSHLLPEVMMMPMLSEMPRVSSDAARESARALHRASTIVILGTSGMYYWVRGKRDGC